MPILGMYRRRNPLHGVAVLVACAAMLLGAGQGVAGVRSSNLAPALGVPPSVLSGGSALSSGGGSSSPGVVNLASQLGHLVVPDGTCSSGRGGTCPHLQTAISVAPSVICQVGTTCPAGVPRWTNVTIWANATGHSQLVYPPKVQVIFDIETTLFDGVYDPTAGDVGLSSCNGPCKESNAVPFFVANAGTIAKDITGDFPGSNVTFAMVDYFSTSNIAPPSCTTGGSYTGDHDDGDGCQYHVDFKNFVDATKFGTLVPPYFANYTLGNGAASCTTGAQPPVMYCDSDFSDNTLDSSSITSLYGALQGSGIQVDKKADVVIVWMGSTAPRDPSYTVDYTPFDADANTGTSATCEPSFNYIVSGLVSPNCEGWVTPTTANYSIADLALSKTPKILINTVVLDTGTTLQTGGDYVQPTSAAATQDTTNIVKAACDLATATGGAWAGPVGFSCNGASGYLSGGFIPAGSEQNPPTAWSSNPLLGTALTNVRFPLGWTNSTANGVTTNDTFQFIPEPGFAIPRGASYTLASCYRSPTNPGLPWPCPSSPNATGLANGGVGWAWPHNATEDAMYLNDSWGVTFPVEATAALNSSFVGVPVPVDACQAQLFPSCTGPVSGSISAANYLPYTNAPPPVSASFPAGTVTVYDTGPVVRISAAPSSVDVRPVVPMPGVYSTVLTASVLGGSGIYGYGWSGLPPGCYAADLASVVCSPTSTGTYTVSVAVTDSHNVTGTASFTLVVHPDPVAVLSATPWAGPTPLFTVANATITQGLAPYKVDLSWGDRFNDSTSLPAHHAYLLAGTYHLALTVTDAVGGEAFSSLSVAPVVPLSVGLKVLPNSEPFEQRNVAFNATILNGSGLFPYFFSWSGLPGGCIGGNLAQITCAPTGPSPFAGTTVTVYVQDFAGENASATQVIHIRALPIVVLVPIVGWVPEDKLVSDLVTVLVGFLVGLIAYFVLIAVYRYARERTGKDEDEGPSGRPPPGPSPVAALAAPAPAAVDAGPPPGAPSVEEGPPSVPGELPPAPPFVVPEGPPLPGSKDAPLPSSDEPGGDPNAAPTGSDAIPDPSAPPSP
ncbi:MAG: hypothetical protein KGJ23_01030 [Euryarchaeota archaeon]|nr:hypothetical protein [Euryarchaeota archaeon]